MIGGGGSRDRILISDWSSAIIALDPMLSRAQDLLSAPGPAYTGYQGPVMNNVMTLTILENIEFGTLVHKYLH